MTTDPESTWAGVEAGLTNQELMEKYLRLAKKAEAEADAIKRRIKDRVRRDIFVKVAAQEKFWKGRDVPGEIDFLTSKAASADPAWKTQVAMNQWYMQQATMFGTAANNDLLRALLRAMKSND
jgi:hypothetical protein